MSKDNTVEELNPVHEVIQDQLTDFIRNSAASLLQTALEAEVKQLISKFKEQTVDNQLRIVRNGYLPERNIQTGVGGVKVKMPRIRDRLDTENKIVFNSSLIPKYMRRTVTLDLMLPLLYLKGISTNDFNEVLEPMLGKNAKTISPGVISSLKKSWHDEFNDWKNRDLTAKRYVYFWVDGVYLKARMASEKNCMLVIVGADEHGNKELVAMDDGFRESKESWLSLLRDLKNRGLTYSPHLAIGDGALGFWGAITEVFPKSSQQRCWVHKTANVLDKLPKALQPKAKAMLHEIYLSDTKKNAHLAFDEFIAAYKDKYVKATTCLAKDKQELMAFYDFPARHWQHIRTTNPIESTFATIKHRTRKSRGCFSRDTIVASTYKLLREAEKRWKKLYGYKQLADVINLVKFIDGIDERKIKVKLKNEVAA